MSTGIPFSNRRALSGLAAALLVAALVGGCAAPNSPEQLPAKVVDLSPGKVVSPADQAAVLAGDSGPAGTILDELKNPKSVLSKRSIYFDYDQFVVRDEYKPLVEAHARFLASHANYRMLVQGNADERGSREYNLALGQKRADALKKALQLLGAREAQIEAVSLGKEKPKNEGHDEAAWAENRRDDMLYKDGNKAGGEF